MEEVNGYHIIEPEVTEVERDDASQNSGMSVKDGTDLSIDEAEGIPANGNEKASGSLYRESTNPVERDGDLEKNNDIPGGMIGKTSLLEETDFVDDSMRCPAAVIVGANYKFPVRSRYLSASVGSCHDLCKYGHKHELEKKIKRPMLRTIKDAQSLMSTISDDLATSAVNKEAKTKALHRRLSLPGPSVLEKNFPKHINMNRSEKDLHKSKSKHIQSEIKPDSGYSSSRSKCDIQTGKVMAIQNSNIRETMSPRVKELKARKGAGNHSKGDKEKAKEPMAKPICPKMPLKKSPSIRARLYTNLRSFSRSKNQSICEGTKINASGEVPEKTLHMIEPNIDKKTAKATSKVAPSNEVSPKIQRGSHVAKCKGSKGTQQGIRIRQSSSSPPSTSVASKEFFHASKEPSKCKGKNQRNLNSVNAKQIGSIKADGVLRTNTSGAKSTLDPKMKTKRSVVSHPEQKEGSAWKVKFNRGAVVTLQVANSAPRKLRFKRGRVLGDDKNAKVETAGSLKGKKDTGNEPHHIKTETREVRLRHQEASEKKDDVDLNNMIEETASKLVKTRKSKVKALVGAFESVMSLRGHKPSVETVYPDLLKNGR